MEAALHMKADHIERTVSKERGRLLNFIKKSVPSVEDAEDILQDVFYQFISGYDEIKSLDRVSSWLFRVARNKITDLYRKKKPDNFSQYTAGLAAGDDDSPLMLEDILPDLTSLPDQAYIRTVIWDEVHEALQEMPQEQRDVFVAHEFEDQSFKDMEKAMGIPVNTLLSRKRYAILFLRKHLQRLYKEL